jgi:hypothetical protein
MARNDRNRTLENITIAFRNFAGKEDVYNRAGDRNFAILLDDETARALEQDGWNVKYLREREEGDGQQAYIQVAVSYKNRPPKICMITSKGMTYLGEAEVELLDWADIETADVTLNPYEWAVNNKSGTKAYLHALYVKIEEDYLQLKWTAWIEGNRKEAAQLEASEVVVIEGEYQL